MSVRAKFTCIKIEVSNAIKYDKDSKAFPAKQASISLIPVYEDNPENKQFFISTPCGSIEFQCTNEEAFKQFEKGKEYYVDFTLAETKPETSE